MKLEVGKFYKNGRGDVREIIADAGEFYWNPFVDQTGCRYKEDGSALYSPSDFNLIEEVKAEELPLKLEVGKFYINYKGEVRKIVRCSERKFKFQFYDEEGFYYNEHGGYGGYGGISPTLNDLIKEVKEPIAETLLVPKGRVLQYRRSKDSDWEDIHTCSGDFEYRVKPIGGSK